MKQELLFSGIGGQGVMVLGETLCNVAVEAGYQVTFVPFYGQEKRGGRTMCNIVIADSMESPIISEASLMMIMDEQSFDDYEALMAPNGTMLVNSSMVDRKQTNRQNYEMVPIPFNQIAAEQLGNSKVANMVALGAIARRVPYLAADKFETAIQQSFSAKPKLIQVNLDAFHTGYQYRGLV